MADKIVYASAKQAAQILHVTTSNLNHWRERKYKGEPIFGVDLRENGRIYYKRSRLNLLINFAGGTGIEKINHKTLKAFRDSINTVAASTVEGDKDDSAAFCYNDLPAINPGAQTESSVDEGGHEEKLMENINTQNTTNAAMTATPLVGDNKNFDKVDIEDVFEYVEVVYSKDAEIDCVDYWNAKFSADFEDTKISCGVRRRILSWIESRYGKAAVSFEDWQKKSAATTEQPSTDKNIISASTNSSTTNADIQRSDENIVDGGADGTLDAGKTDSAADNENVEQDEELAANIKELRQQVYDLYKKSTEDELSPQDKLVKDYLERVDAEKLFMPGAKLDTIDAQIKQSITDASARINGIVTKEDFFAKVHEGGEWKELEDYDGLKLKVLEGGNIITSNLFDGEIIAASAIVQVYEPATYDAALAKVDEYKLPKSRFKNLVKEFSAQIRLFADIFNAVKNARQNALNALNGDTDNVMAMPLLASINDGRLFYGGKLATETPVGITRQYRRADGTYCVDLTVKTNDQEKVIAQVNRSVVASKHKIIQLADEGLSVNTKTAEVLVDYLSDYLHVNREFLKPVTLFEKCGWRSVNGKLIFIKPNGAYPVDALKVPFLTKNVQTGGSFDAWKDLEREVCKYPLARLDLDAALATPLLKILNVRSFSVYKFGDSRIGKTTSMKFAASAVGTTELVRTFNATINGVEAALSSSTDYPVFIDEKQQTPGHLSLEQLIYLIGNGTGKLRMNADCTQKKSFSWRTIALMTGEEPIVEDIKRQGGITRLLQIECKGEILPVELARRIHAEINQNYGFCADAFIDALQKEDFNELRELHNYFTDELKAKIKRELVNDHYSYLALVAVADYLRLKNIDGIADDFARNSALGFILYVIAPLIQSKKELSDAEREWQLIEGWLANKATAVIGLLCNDPKDCANRNDTIGEFKKYEGEDGKGKLYIIGAKLREFLERQGLKYSKVIRDLGKAGYIETFDGDNTTRARVNTVSVRCVVIPYEKI